MPTIKEIIQFEPAAQQPHTTNEFWFMPTGGFGKLTVRTLTISSNVKINI